MRDEQADVEQDVCLELVQRWRTDPDAFWDEAKAVNGFRCSYRNAIKKHHCKQSVSEVRTESELPPPTEDNEVWDSKIGDNKIPMTTQFKENNNSSKPRYLVKNHKSCTKTVHTE